MSELQNKLNLILNEKTNKILPENIKSGINIFGVAGNVRSVSNNMYTMMKYLPVEVEDGYPYTNDSDTGYDFIYPTYMWEQSEYISLPNVFYFSVLDKTNNNFKVYWTDSIGSTYVDYDESNSQLNLHIDTSLPEAVFCSTLQVNNLDVLPLFSDSVNGYNSGWVESLNKYSWNTVNMQGRKTSITYNLLDINLEFYASSIYNATDVMQEAKTGSILEGTTAYDKFGNILSGGMPKRTNVAVLNSKIVPSENVINISPRFTGYYTTNSVLQINNLGLASKIGLTADKLKSGESVLDITGNYAGSGGYILQDGMRFGGSNRVFNNGVGWDTSNVTDMNHMFYNCMNMTDLDVSNFNTSNVIDLSNMFYRCSNLTTLDVSNFNTSNVVDMSNMFDACQNLTNLDVSNWDTSNVQNMNYMFLGCSNLTTLDVSNFNTSNVTSMSSMFHSCSNLTNIDVSNFNTSNVINMQHMFNMCKNLTNIDVGNWNVVKVNSTALMFAYCRNLTTISISNWDTSNVINMQQMFYMCDNLTDIDVSNWNTKNVTIINMMFQQCNNLSAASIDSIINMCINSINVAYKNLMVNNRCSPFYESNITNTIYQNRLTELTLAGWAY